MKKKLSILIILLVVLTACGGKTEEATAKNDTVAEKKSEMTETAALNYLEQITHRYAKVSDYENGSFEQKSELQAAIKKCDSMIKEIKEQYESDLPIASDIINLANQVKEVSQGVLDGNYDSMYDDAVMIGSGVDEISKTYLDGELPPTLKFIAEN